jgi:GT2 family glycosyltransferase
LHILADNGSSEGYLNALRAYFPESVIIRREDNGGQTAAWNDGISYALKLDYDAILLIDQDVQISAAAIQHLLGLLEGRSDLGVVGPVLLRRDGKTVEEYGGRIRRQTGGVTKLYSGITDLQELPVELEVDFVAGGINLTRREVFEQVGLQDEQLFMYCEETDFDIRVRDHGWRLLVTREAVAAHRHRGMDSVLRPQSLFLQTRNRLTIVRKHCGSRAFARYAATCLAGMPRSVAYYAKRRRTDLALAHVYGVICGVVGIRSFPPSLQPPS